MHIVLYHQERIPVQFYGGTERVIEALCRGFIELGHKVSLISFKGDYSIPGVNHLYLDSLQGQDLSTEYIKLIPPDADIIHYHVPCRQDEIDLPCPYVSTQHGNMLADEDPSTLPKNTIFISKNHAKRHGRGPYVYNGLDYREIPLNQTPLLKRQGYSFLGKASLKRKGLDSAKKIARHFKKKLFVAGGRGIPWRGVSYLGPVNNERKFELLGKTQALLFPIRWEEPFGLVMIEAMFCGTPVFALQRGSVPEVLLQEDKAKEFNLVAEDVYELIHQIEKHQLTTSPQTIREYAERNFGHLKMCEGYLNYYEKVRDGEDLFSPSSPIASHT